MALQECDGCKKEIIIYANEDTVCLHCGKQYPKVPSIKLEPHVKQQVTIKLLKNRIDTVLMWCIRIYTGITALGYTLVIFDYTHPLFQFIAALIFQVERTRLRGLSQDYVVIFYQSEFFFLLPVVIILIAVIVRYLLFSKTYQE